jgi:hypothetical protein
MRHHGRSHSRRGTGPRCWRGASVDVLLVAIAAGRPDALGEVLRRYGRPAVNVALRVLLDADDDGPATLIFLRKATAEALAAYRPERARDPRGGGRAMCDHGR